MCMNHKRQTKRLSNTGSQLLQSGVSHEFKHDCEEEQADRRSDFYEQDTGAMIMWHRTATVRADRGDRVRRKDGQ